MQIEVVRTYIYRTYKETIDVIAQLQGFEFFKHGQKEHHSMACLDNRESSCNLRIKVIDGQEPLI